MTGNGNGLLPRFKVLGHVLNLIVVFIEDGKGKKIALRDFSFKFK